MNIKWDANGYTQNFSFVHEYGNDVINLIDVKNGASVLDLRCGNGALTKTLSEKGMFSIGLDGSEDLLKIAKENYPDILFYKGDATDFELSQKVDVVFSNAVFHWIEKGKQPDMLNCVYKALNKNGQFVFEFGGYGNNSLIHSGLKAAFEKRNLEYEFLFYFHTIGEYSSLMEEASFKVVYAVLFERMTELKSILYRDGKWYADYVRIRCKAIKE